MDLFAVMRETADDMTGGINDLFVDLQKLWRASRVVCLGVVGVGILRGVGPALVLQTVGRFVDAAIGARGVGVVTGEVREYFWTTLLFIVLTFGAFVVTRKFSGLAASIISRLVQALEPLSLLVIAWPMLEGTLSWVLVLLVLRVPFRHPIVLAATSVCIATVTLLTVNDVLTFAATRTMTVGSMLAVGGASLLFGLTIAARPYLVKLLT